MSSVVQVPQWLIAKTGEQISPKFMQWVSGTKAKLLKAFPPAERGFCRIISKMISRLSPRWKKRLWYTRQKYFVVAPGVVFFGDYFFRNTNILVEIDGNSHIGGVAKEKDEWRTKLISAWKVKTIRRTNSQILDGDFRDTERWFIEEMCKALPPSTAASLDQDYHRMISEHPHIYQRDEVSTTWTKGS